jgi:hypothetical protein
LSFLVGKKDEIDKQIRSVNDLDSKIQEGSILVNMNYSIFNILLFSAILVVLIFLYMSFFSNNEQVNNLGDINNGSQRSVIVSVIFFVILFICGFIAWINKTTIENWFKKYFYNSSYLI